LDSFRLTVRDVTVPLGAADRTPSLTCKRLAVWDVTAACDGPPLVLPCYQKSAGWLA
jgi:hypothetical protein